MNVGGREERRRKREKLVKEKRGRKRRVGERK